MARKEWQKAQPYAVAAAETGAEWAMRCATKCFEGMEEWNKAELWVRRTAERYQNAGQEWYVWCVRTRRGNLHGAVKLSVDTLESGQRRVTGMDPYVQCHQAILGKQPEKALQPLQELFTQTRDFKFQLLIALLAEELDKKEVRDAALK